jgi:hypothetical protein
MISDPRTTLDAEDLDAALALEALEAALGEDDLALLTLRQEAGLDDLALLEGASISAMGRRLSELRRRGRGLPEVAAVLAA